MKRTTSTPVTALGLLTLLCVGACDSKERDFDTATTQSEKGDSGSDDAPSDEPSDVSDPAGTGSVSTSDSDTEPPSQTEDTDEMSSAEETEDTDTETEDTSTEETSETETESDTDVPAETSESETDAMETSAGGGGNTDEGEGGSAGEDPIRGEGGTENEPDTTVRGRIVDFWNHPMADVVVMLGDESATTNDEGHFEFEAAPDEYDISFIAHWQGSNEGFYGYRYEGLTRRDPTLQAFTGVTDHGATVTLTASSITYGDNTNVAVAFGGPDGASTHSVSENGSIVSPTWRGPSSTSPGYHALFWETTDDLPTSYLGYDEGVYAFTANDQSELDVDPTELVDINSGNVEGSVTAQSGADRSNSVFVRFRDGARIQLVDDYGGADEFSYIAPSLPEASIVLVATEGWLGDGIAIAYRAGVTPGNDPTKLAIPRYPTTLLPAGGAQVTPEELSLRWEGDDTPVVIHIENTGFYEGFYIVTSKKEVPFGQFVGGAAVLVPGGEYWWSVQFHGTFESVDEMTGEEGFLNPFSIDGESPLGPRAGEGYYAESPRPIFSVPL